MTRNPIELAEAIAIEAHRGQVDKAGVDYITHPVRVARNAQTVPHAIGLDSTDLQVVALLHDVLEDGPDNGYHVDLEDWLAKGITPQQIDAIQLLTYRAPNLPREMKRIERDAIKTKSKIDYYNALKRNPLARAVKLADLADNCNEQRRKALVESGAHFDPSKYPLALAIIEPTTQECAWFREALNVIV